MIGLHQGIRCSSPLSWRTPGSRSSITSTMKNGSPSTSRPCPFLLWGMGMLLRQAHPVIQYQLIEGSVNRIVIIIDDRLASHHREKEETSPDVTGRRPRTFRVCVLRRVAVQQMCLLASVQNRLLGLLQVRCRQYVPRRNSAETPAAAAPLSGLVLS